MENNHRKRTVFDRFMAWLLSLLQSSLIGKYFTSYDKANDRFERLTKRKASPSHKRRFAKLTENNRLVRAIPKMYGYLMRLALRDYGIAMFMCGAVVSILYPMNNMILFIDVTLDMFVYGCATCLCAIPLMFSSRSLASNVLSSKFFSTLLFDYLGFDEESFRQQAEQETKHGATLAFVFGALIGVLGYFVMPPVAVLLVGVVVLAYCVMRTPEIGVVVSVFSIPFANIMYISGAVAYTFLCYIIKIMLGKRIFKFEYFDFWVCIAIIGMTVCGINYSDPVSSIKEVLINLVIMLSYFMFSNLIHSKEWFKRSIVAFTMSSLIVAAVATAQAILGKISESFEILQPVFSPDMSITSTLGSSNALAQLLVVAIPFALVHMISERNDINKFAGFLLSALLVAALFFAGSPSAVVGLFVGAMLLFAFYNRNAVYLIIVVAAALPIMYYTLPREIIDQIITIGPLKNASITEELTYLKDAFAAAWQNPFGIGSGEVAMNNALPQYNGYIDSLPAQLLAVYGVIGCGIFVLCVLMYARLMLSYAAKAKNEYRRVNCCAGLCSTLALLSSGIFNYAWLDKRIFLLLIATIGLSFAYIKIDREEEAVVKGYIDITSSCVDILLKEEDVGDIVPRRRYVHIIKEKKPKGKNKTNEKKVEAKEFSHTQELISIKLPNDTTDKTDEAE